MLGRHVFEAVQQLDGSWRVRKSGNNSLGDSYADRASAIAAGKRLAFMELPSKLILQNSEGLIEEEFVFGEDPGLVQTPE